MTADELKKIIEREDPEYIETELDQQEYLTDMLGFDAQDPRIIEITNLFRNIENLSNREKISRFGNFYRAIIQIRNREPESILTVVYILLKGALGNQFVGDITLEKLREFLNKKISNDVIRTLFNRNNLIEKLDKLQFISGLDELAIRQFTYIEFIDAMFEDLAITPDTLQKLLS